MSESDLVCIVCGVPSTRLCDYQLGWDTKVDKTGHVPRLVKTSPFTCDVPLCDEHATEINAVHYCGKNGCERDSRDRCPKHVGLLDRSDLLTPFGAASLRAKARIVLVPQEGS